MRFAKGVSARICVPVLLASAAAIGLGQARGTEIASAAGEVHGAAVASAAAAARGSLTVAAAVQPRIVASESVRVVSAAPVAQSDDAITTSATSEQVRTTAGTYSDIPRFLQTMPGVMFDTDARNTYLVNGGNPFENMVVVDGVTIPNINHISTANTSGGFVSMIDTDAVATVKLHKMLYGSQYEGALSSVLEVKTRDVDRLGLHGDASLGYAGVDLVLEKRIARQFSTVTEVRNSVVNYFTNDIGIDGVPVYRSVLSKTIFSPSERDTVSTLYLQGVDSLDIRPNLKDVQDPGFLSTAYTGNRATVAATWDHRSGESGQQALQFAFSRVSSGSVQRNEMQGNALVDSDSLLDRPATMKYDYAGDWEHMGLRAGAEGSLHGLHYAIAQPVGLPSPYRLNPGPADASNIDTTQMPMDGAGYGEATYHRPSGLQVTGGGRFQHFGLDGESRFSPRVSVQSGSWKGAYLYGGVARYSQLAPLPMMLGVASNQGLKPITDTQMQVGLVRRGDDGSRVTVSLYRKLYRDYPVSTEYPSLSLADIVDPFGQPFVYLPFTSAGTGVASGAEIEFASSLGRRGFVQANVASQQVTHKALDGVARRANFDMPVLANVVAGVRLTERQRLSTRFGYHTGTPYIGFLVVDSHAQARAIYDLSRINTQRGPDYARLDLRYEIDVPVRGRPFELYLGLDNVLARKNFYQYAIVPHCSFCAPYELTQQGFLPEGGVTYRF